MRWAGPRTYTTGCIASGSVCMPVEPTFDEATPMMIDVPVRHADSDEDSDDDALPSVIVAAMENLNILFSDLRLNDGPRYFGEDFDVEALCASFSRLFIVEMPAHDVYPSNVLIFDDPPLSVGFFNPYHVAAVSNTVEVMVIGAGTSTAPGKASAGAGEPAVAAADTLRDAIVGLKTPVTASANPADARASLEEARKRILEEGIAVASAKRRLEATQREYNSAYGLTPISEAPSRRGSVRSRGLFIAEVLGDDLPTYETPAANMRAVQEAMEEMASVEGEERAFQEKRVKDLLDAANQQHARLDPSQAQSESPGPNSGACRNTREDWLIDYTTPVGIARGNKRVTVRYVPLMLTGLARTWLNSLPAGSVNSWVDFEEAFVRNFTGTYKRPSRPHELAMCVQKADEPLRDYVTRWTELHNSREGVHEVQAIQYFIDGCRDGTLLKHKLMCTEPTSLAVLMAKADKYATADSVMRVKVSASDKVVPTPASPKPAGDNRGGQNNYKRKADQMDPRSNNKLVASMEGEASAPQAGPPRKASQQKQHQLAAQAVLRAASRRPLQDTFWGAAVFPHPSAVQLCASAVARGWPAGSSGCAGGSSCTGSQPCSGSAAAASRRRSPPRRLPSSRRSVSRLH
ncbi:hypothetical protein ZWY2020_022120 [Hordeum vulgare]|nr:hypothetical protein ZWY2020_022120 [Hordeum vulgare]